MTDTDHTASNDRPDTVVLVHGLWMTPRSWEHWAAYYRDKGLTVLTPGYPGFEIEVEALRENPQVIAELTVPQTLDHLEATIRSVAGVPPIIMGHSFGGTPSTDRMAASRWSSVSGTVRLAMTSGFSRNASTSISKPGYAGAITVRPLAV